MKITVHRVGKGVVSTLGILSIDGELISWTLEDEQRPKGEKIHGKTAIPPGIYRCAIRHSPSMKREVVWILDVPGFEYVYIHSGNTAADTLGCILVAEKRLDNDFIQGKSKTIESRITAKVKAAIKAHEDIWCEIIAVS